MALREDEVQPPNTAATQSLLISFWAFSANTVGSEAPSSATTCSCLPRTPPESLISLAAMLSESNTVFSLIAMVPDREFRKPIFTVGPDVSTHDFAAVAVPPESTFAPQADSIVTSARHAAATATVRVRAWEPWGLYDQGRTGLGALMVVPSQRSWGVPRGTTGRGVVHGRGSVCGVNLSTVCCHRV